MMNYRRYNLTAQVISALFIVAYFEFKVGDACQVSM